MQGHAVVVLERVQPDPGEDVLAGRGVLVERLVHVPEDRNVGHRWYSQDRLGRRGGRRVEGEMRGRGGQQVDRAAGRVDEVELHAHVVAEGLLHLLGFDHEQLTHFYQGRNFRLTDVHGKVVSDIIA